jgi:hypothetical protein
LLATIGAALAETAGVLLITGLFGALEACTMVMGARSELCVAGVAVALAAGELVVAAIAGDAVAAGEDAVAASCANVLAAAIKAMASAEMNVFVVVDIMYEAKGFRLRFTSKAGTRPPQKTFRKVFPNADGSVPTR